MRTSEELTVEETPAEQSFILRQQEGCVLILKAIDADTGKGVPKVMFFPDWLKRSYRGTVGANSDQGIVTILLPMIRENCGSLCNRAKAGIVWARCRKAIMPENARQFGS